ncbi:MAG TPA: ATP-binding protein [Thermoanaerobaculia bacterium]|nr:ATP-binding protein [Thermoanaerobaculia bacterium]
MTGGIAGRASSRDRVIRAFVVQGVAGLLLMIAASWFRREEVATIAAALGDTAPVLIAIFFLFALALSFLKFELTEDIFVSFAMVAFIAMMPILGVVLSCWVAVLAVISNRIADMAGIGPIKLDMEDPVAEIVRTFGLFGTYGIPIIIATFCYEAAGGVIPLAQPSIAAAGRIAFAGMVMILTNSLIMSRVQRAYGYPRAKIVRSTVTDVTVLALGIPFAFTMTFAFALLGWFGVASVAFTGVMVNWVVRSLSIARSANAELVERLSSLTNIGTSISISGSRDELLMAIYTECRRVVDTSLFSIALVDEQRDELSAELFIENGQIRPKFRVPIGKGLNSWVVQNKKPLLLRNSREELLHAIRPIDDGLATESWLGVPMMSHERVIGVISVQSYRRNAFRDDDVVLLGAVANQAAVAIENARLYQDLEGLYLALEERVAERTAELHETNLRLIAADGTKSRFLAHMSHELRTPLNSIIGFSRILLDKLQKEISPRLFRFIENIHASGSHLLSLINEILDLSKIEAGKLDLHIEHFSLPETIGAVERVIKGMATEAQVTVVTTIGEDVGEVSMDEGRVKQILLNLLSNAVRFSPQRAFVRLRAVRMSSAESLLGADTIRIDVTDEGSGIPPEELSRIFDEFYQVSDPKAARGGTGLGLPLTKRFVELHQGAIHVDSSPGKGSSFTVYLPIEPLESVRVRMERSDARSSGIR